MALDPSTRYPGQIDTSDPVGYPHGAARDIVVVGDGIGTPLQKDLVNDIFGAQQALLKAANITPSGVPDKVGASQYLTALKTVAVDVASKTAALAALQDWRAQQLPSGPNYRFLVTTTIPDRTKRALIAIGASGSVAGFARSMGSGQFEGAPQIFGSAVGPFFAASGALGNFYYNNSTQLVRHTDLTTQETEPAANVEAFFCAPNSATPYIFFTSDAQIYKSTTFLSGYSAAARPSGMTVFQSSTVGVPGGEFAYDGANDICYNSVITISGVTRSRVLRSVDGGTTWTLAFTAASGVSLSICYSEADGGDFVILDSNGNLYFGDDNFAVPYASPITAAAGASAHYSTFAACGRVIAKAMDTLLLGASCIFAGIAYSFDWGVTWRYASVSDHQAFNAAEGVLRLISANGRLWALTPNGYVHQSGQIEYESPL